jgi:IS30 family transposase
MVKKSKLKRLDRLEIAILLEKKYSLRAIARSMGRSPNTISYEVKANGGMLGYNPRNADIYAKTRKKNTRREWSKIEHTPELREYIITGLTQHWNPDEISGRMKDEMQPWYASKTAIYTWLRSVHGQRYCHLLYSKSYYEKPHTKKTDRVMIPNRVGIEERPLTANDRIEAGHWERDTIVSRKGCRGGLSVGSERVSRLIDVVKVKSMSTFEHMAAVKQQREKYKTLSETFDNGIENKAHELLGIPTYFCEPYSSWQKGGVENANKMLRRYFPKGTAFRTVSQKQVDAAVALINNKPRKILNYKTALEVARARGILKSINQTNGLSVLIGG